MKESFVLAILAGPAILYVFRIIYFVGAGYDFSEKDDQQLMSKSDNSDNLFDELIHIWKSPTRRPVIQKHKQPRSTLEDLYQRSVPRESFVLSSTRPSELLSHTELLPWNISFARVTQLANERPLFLRQDLIDGDCCILWPYDFYKLPFSKNDTIDFNSNFVILPWIGELNYVVPLKDLYKMDIYHFGQQAQTIYNDDLGDEDEEIDDDEDEYIAVSRNHITVLQHLYSELIHLYDDINEAPPADFPPPMQSMAPNAIIWEGRVKILRAIFGIAIASDNLVALENLEILWRILFLELDEKFGMIPPVHWQQEHQRVAELLIESESDWANPEHFENI